MSRDTPHELDADEVELWCESHLPDIYNVGLYDSEDIADDVWDAVAECIQESVLDHVGEHPEIREQLLDAAHEWFSNYHTDILDTIATVGTVDPEILLAIQQKPQVEQHTAEWYAQRRNRLTASEFHSILTGRRGALLRSKIEPPPEGAYVSLSSLAPVAISSPDGDMMATVWGHRFEPIVRDIYEREPDGPGLGTVCDTLGRLTHATIPWLSASPDGIVLQGPMAGRLIEIKAPKTRIPGDFVPEDYYVQMQVQMEVADLDVVDFLEARFAQSHIDFLTPEQLETIAAAKWKGRIQVFGSGPRDSWVYRYSQPTSAADFHDAEWKEPAPEIGLLEDSVWWLVSWSPRTVLRNRDWWTTIGWPMAEAFWADVETGRAEYVAPPPVVVEVERVGWMGST